MQPRAGDRTLDRLELRDRRLEPSLRAAVEPHHLTSQRSEDVAIAGVARARHHDAVADLERREEGEQVAARRAGRRDDVVDLIGRPGAVSTTAAPRTAGSSARMRGVDENEF